MKELTESSKREKDNANKAKTQECFHPKPVYFGFIVYLLLPARVFGTGLLTQSIYYKLHRSSQLIY